MKKLLLILLLIPVLGFSQYSVRFVLNDIDCAADVIKIDLEVKSKGAHFFLAEQNYRFSFNDNAVINPRIVQELEISGNTFSNEYSAFFEPHHLNGSLDTIVSYNVVLNGGSGYLVDSTRWYPVGRIAFDIIGNTCMELKWHTHAPNDFPPTYIGGKEDGILYELEEGSYEGFIHCLYECETTPIELVDFSVEPYNCGAKIEWETASEVNNDYFSVQIKTSTKWFEVIQITGKNSPYKYEYQHHTIDEITYFRLAQVDFDGTIQYSDIEVVRPTCKVGVTEVFPTIVQKDDYINVKYNAPLTGTAELLVWDVIGKTVIRKTVHVKEGAGTVYTKQSLPKGAYFVQIRQGTFYSRVFKIIKVC